MPEYLIKCKDIDSMLITFHDYVSLVGESVEYGAPRVNQLVGLESFRGKAAVSIKAYFSKVHLPLMYSFLTLFTQLEMLYCEYADSYFSGDIGESEIACLPKREMIYVKNRFRSFFETDLPTIEKLLQSSASQAGEAGCAVCKPGMNSLDTALRVEIDEIGKLDNGIVTAESKGSAAFSDNDLLESLARAVSAAITACAKPGYAENFNEALFLSTPIATRLYASMQNCEEYQSQNWDKMISAENAAMTREQKRIQIEYEKAAANKMFFSYIGTVASLVGVVLAVTAVVAATGPLGIAFATFALYQAGKNATGRMNEFIEISNGNYEFDRDKKSELEKNLGEFSKTGGKELTEYEKGHAADFGKNTIKDVYAFGTEIIVEEAGLNIGLDEDEASAFGDASGETLSFVFDVADDGISPENVTSFGTKVVTIVADYEMEKSDHILDDCNKRDEELNEKKEANGQRQQIRYFND